MIGVSKSEICALIPHAGTMCLLDGVSSWDERSIVCTSETHRDPNNPLRRNGQLSAVHAFEYAAQATAVHGGLRARAAGATASPGYLAAIRDARLHVARLDDIAASLEVSASHIFGDKANTVYECRVTAGDHPVAEARITIMLRT